MRKLLLVAGSLLTLTLALMMSPSSSALADRGGNHARGFFFAPDQSKVAGGSCTFNCGSGSQTVESDSASDCACDCADACGSTCSVNDGRLTHTCRPAAT